MLCPLTSLFLRCSVESICVLYSVISELLKAGYADHVARLVHCDLLAGCALWLRADKQHKMTPPATPLLTPAASREPTPAPSVAPAPVLVFRADPRMTTTFASLPDSAEVRHLFNV